MTYQNSQQRAEDGADKIEAQKERAFRAAFGDRPAGTGIHVYGPVSTSVMQWGIDRGYLKRLGETTAYELTEAGELAMKEEA